MSKYSDFEGNGPQDFSEDTNKRLLHGYAAATSYMDACIGRILEALKRNDLDKNTIVVLWGDHGWKLGDHSSWCKHTNFECDTRVPLVIRDPRVEGGKRTKRLVELIDLYPTLCELSGLPTPAHCQGRSFRHLLEAPEAGHRLDAYSSYPTPKGLGHSIRFKTYRYTEWLNRKNQMIANVLTDLSIDPGEQSNVKNDPLHAEALDLGKQRLRVRIKEAGNSSYQASKPSELGPPLQIEVNLDRPRQKIDGFGGSIAFWGTNPDDETMSIAFEELKTSLLRVQGEVSRKGSIDHNKEVLLRAMKINPQLEVLLTFWQPRSAELLEAGDWMDEVKGSEYLQYSLKASMEEAWASEIVKRTCQYLDWGVNVTTIGVQNETNYSKVGSQTCVWDPQRLSHFIEKKLIPRMKKAGLDVRITAPDLAYVGYQGSEISRFLPTIQNQHVDIVAYHMYDSFRDDMDGSLEILRENTNRIGQIRRREFPEKKFWMTETTGAQWNNDEWHTYGWSRGMTEFDKAMRAAEYIHMTFTDAGANAFLWWGLIYSLAPERETNPDIRQKHRDEGLVLVEEKTGTNGRQKLVGKTKKFHFFKQYANFIRPGFRRIEVDSTKPLLVSAFLDKEEDGIVVVAINPSESSQSIKFNVPEDMKLIMAHQTDRNLNCQLIDSITPMPPHSIRTLAYNR